MVQPGTQYRQPRQQHKTWKNCRDNRTTDRKEMLDELAALVGNHDCSFPFKSAPTDDRNQARVGLDRSYNVLK